MTTQAAMSNTLSKSYIEVRKQSEELCKPLITEDYVVQTMPDVSPPKWHLAHTSWFFETFILAPYLENYRRFNEPFNDLFNSYYNGVGNPYPRPKRGFLTRPSVDEVFHYRSHVDQYMGELSQKLDRHPKSRLIQKLTQLGINHEQQHQELLLTDIKHIFAQNPLFPVYSQHAAESPPFGHVPLFWTRFPGGEAEIGHVGDGFSFDNELPRHRVILNDYSLTNRLVTNREYKQFIDDGGYSNPLLWLSDGWATVQNQSWAAPLYWLKQDDHWQVVTLGGLKPLNPNEPVCHISYYEADAFATWCGKRLPSETEWEHAAGHSKTVSGNFVESGFFHPKPAESGNSLQQLFGDVWEWTRSAYTPYPEYRPAEGAIGEYNGKFMCNQMVLRGGSCATPKNHIRKTYRNFFYPHNRWQFMGFRLASDQ